MWEQAKARVLSTVPVLDKAGISPEDLIQKAYIKLLRYKQCRGLSEEIDESKDASLFFGILKGVVLDYIKHCTVPKNNMISLNRISIGDATMRLNPTGYKRTVEYVLSSLDGAYDGSYSEQDIQQLLYGCASKIWGRDVRLKGKVRRAAS